MSYMLHTKLLARPGKRDGAVAQFERAARIQQSNADCYLMFVSVSTTEADVLYLTEVWSDKEVHQQAKTSAAIVPWATEMPTYIERLIESTELTAIGGKGLDRPPLSGS